MSPALLALSIAVALHGETPSHAAAAGEEVATVETEGRALPRVTVLGRRENLIGEAISASEGVVGPEELSERPRLRAGDIVEYVPGMIATQHSGSGKANQYFLRGFNLDHGTDFATFVDGMPVNLRSHGHGQGYSDLNFLIPELVDELTYRKGPYHADVGDFSSAGSASFRLAERLNGHAVEASAGEFGWLRGLAIGTVGDESLALTYGVEAQRYDGPWQDIEEDVAKKNIVLKVSGALGSGRAHAAVMAYDNEWNSPDQIPQRAVDAGLIDALGSLDTTLGGGSSRRSLSAGWQGPLAGGAFSASAYTIAYDLSLWSNFTYFLDDSGRGDQFRQFDQRRIHGFDLADSWRLGRGELRVGAQYRFDDIDRVGLSRTDAREFVRAIRDDEVEEASLGLFVEGQYKFNDRLRGYAGLRRDRYDFEVDAIEPENSGDADDDDTSLKASLVYSVSAPLELYASWGQGLHSNDARGTTITLDPVSGDPVDRVDPLVDATGSELGARVFFSERVHATLSLWQLDLDSELVFVGDAGATEASRRSARDGIELGVYWFGGEHWSAELEASYTDARFDDYDPAGDEIPGAIPLVLSAGLTGDFGNGWFATARVRHFGEYPLIEDDSVESEGSTLLNLRLGKRWQRWTATLDLLNALDSDDHDVDYFYASRLRGEADDGVEDIHFHAFEPRAVRATLRYEF